MARTTERATCWSVVINNPIQADDENIATARQKGWKVEGQLERGTEGTPHYQLCVKTPQVRFSQVKAQFPRAHIDVARNVVALQRYVVKEETREAPLPTSQEAYPSQQKVWEWFGSYHYTREDLLDDYRVYTMKYMESGSSKELLNKHEYGQIRLLGIFDEMIEQKIQEGYYVELIGVNPQIRSAVKNYGFAIMERERVRREDAEKVHRQTDRQTDEKNISAVGITNASSKEEVSPCCEEVCSSS